MRGWVEQLAQLRESIEVGRLYEVSVEASALGKFAVTVRTPPRQSDQHKCSGIQ
jgi:hypothetical protein